MTDENPFSDFIDKAKRKHTWVLAIVGKHKEVEYCSTCGVIKRSNNQDSECKERVGVELR